MNLTRRYQPLPPYAYCTATCGWTDGGAGTPQQIEDGARDHATTTGHEVRAVTSQQVIIKPEQAPAVTQ